MSEFDTETELENRDTISQLFGLGSIPSRLVTFVTVDERDKCSGFHRFLKLFKTRYQEKWTASTGTLAVVCTPAEPAYSNGSESSIFISQFLASSNFRNRSCSRQSFFFKFHICKTILVLYFGCIDVTGI